MPAMTPCIRFSAPGHITIIFSILLAPAAVTPGAGKAISAEAAGLEAVDRYILAGMEKMRLPGAAMVIVQEDRITFTRGYGIAGPSGAPVTPETPFILGSTSKSLTALAVMQAAESGRIDLDAPVQRYLPWFELADSQAAAKITTRHLLLHTSGISAAAGLRLLADADAGPGALEKHVRLLRETAPESPAGARFEYSNANYSVLGMLLQEVTGRTYEDCIRQTIFAPLQMRHSFASQNEAEGDGLATGYRMWFGHPVAAPSMPYVRGLAPAGYLISCASDMAHYLVAHLNEGRWAGAAVVSPQGMAELHRPEAPMRGGQHYAKGWVVDRLHGQPILWHNGSVPNFYSYVALLPESRWGVALLVNASHILSAGELDALARGVPHLLITGELPEGYVTPAAIKMIYAAVIVAVVLQFLWLAWHLARLRQWMRRLRAGPVSRARMLAGITLSLLLCAAWAVSIFCILPAQFDTPLPVMLLYGPDLTLLLVVSGCAAIAWTIFRVGLRLWAIRAA